MSVLERDLRPALLACLLAAMLPRFAHAQGTWQADLMIDPFPSPYISDWEANPNIGTLTLFNNTGSERAVRLTFSLTDHRGAVLASGESDPQALPPGPTIFDSPFDLSGSFDYDVSIEDVIIRTGRLPEGDFTACTVATDGSGFVLAEACSPFSVLYPDPPMLLSPFDGDRVDMQGPFFEWTPLQVPFDYPIHFVLQIAQILPGQTPEQALSSGIPHYEEDLASTSLQYPLGELPFVSGARYAWRVQALDQNGYSASANNGSSEIWTFVYSEGSGGIASVRVSPSADTLAFAGDTVRLVAHALDEYGFELTGHEFVWRSLDTTSVTVDSSGLVTNAGNGGARIIATVDGADDFADTVTVSTGAGGANLRIAFYDPASETPELYQLLESGTYEEIAERLQELLQRGEFVLPLPGIPGLAGETAPGGGSEPALCPGLTLPYYAEFDGDRKSLAIGMRPPVDVAGSLFECLGISDWWTQRPGQKLEMLFAVALPEKGAAQASLGLKLPFVGLFEDLPGIHFNYAVVVLNFWRGFEMDAASTLPAIPEVTAFYPHKFEVKGLDVEYESKRKLGEAAENEVTTTGIGTLNVYTRLDLSRTPIVGLIETLGYKEPVIELQGSLGFSRDGGLFSNVKNLVTGPDSSGASKGGRTFTLGGSLPKRVPQLGNISEYIEWTQLGIELEVESEWNHSGSADTSTVKVTPKLKHTILLQLPLPNWPALKLSGSAGWAGVGTTATDTAAGTDTASTNKSKWTLGYSVGTAESTGPDPSPLILWDFLHLKLGAQIGFTQPTTSSPSEWELKLSGTAGFGSADEAAKVGIAFVRKSSDCGGPGKPACTQPADTPGQPRPPDLKKNEVVLTLESKGLAFGAMLKDVLRLIRELNK